MRDLFGLLLLVLLRPCSSLGLLRKRVSAWVWGGGGVAPIACNITQGTCTIYMRRKGDQKPPLRTPRRLSNNSRRQR